MLGKFRLIPLIAVLILTAMPVSADGLSDSVLSQLRQQGYNEIEMSRTWLGRTRIVARRDGERREIIINPRTGEILRDFWTHEEETDTQILSVPSNGGPGESGGPDAGGGSGGGDDSGGDHGDSDSDGDSGGDSDGGDSDGGDSDGGGDSGDGGEGEGDSGGDD